VAAAEVVEVAAGAEGEAVVAATAEVDTIRQSETRWLVVCG
jgi:hypothetical protein